MKDKAICHASSFFVYTFLTLSVMALISPTANAESNLDIAISSLSAQVTQLTDQITALATDQQSLINKFTTVDTGQCALFIVSPSTTPGVIPLTFVPISTNVVSVQADLVIPSSFSIAGVQAGPEATLDNKSIETSVVEGNTRIVIFGLNQTPIGEGVLAYVLYDVNGDNTGFCPFVLINPVASDANGNSVPVCVLSGGVGL